MSFEVVNQLRKHRFIVVYHANCADGIASAWAVHSEFPYAELIPFSYQKDLSDDFLKLVTNAVVIIVDFSFGRQQLQKICERAKYVELLDHHVTAINSLDGFSADNFDMSSCRIDRSGCGIVWEWLHGSIPMPPLLSHVEDRDIWQFKLSDTKRVMAGLFSDKLSFEAFDSHAYNIVPLQTAGDVALRIQSTHVNSVIFQCKTEFLAGDYTVAIVNCNGMFASEVGDALSSLYHFVITYYHGNNGGCKFSMRSKGNINVANLCKRFGGGGHKNAAGYEDLVGEDAVKRLCHFMRNNDMAEILNN